MKRVEEVKADNSTNDDTDIELDDEFNEESLVTFQSPARRQTRMRKVTVVEAPGHHHHHNHSKCSTGCAQTYQASRDKRRRAVSTIVNPMLHLTSKQTCSTSEDTSATESSDEVTKLVPVRKKSRFTIKKEETKLVEGKWKLIGNRNYEEYLTELGKSLTLLTSDQQKTICGILLFDLVPSLLLFVIVVRYGSLHRGHGHEGRRRREHHPGGGQAVEDCPGDLDQG